MDKTYKIRKMNINDYDEIYELWKGIKGFAIRKIDDSKNGIAKFIKRNKTTCVVATYNKKIIGSILCGHDGRQAYFYHVCVKENMRNKGIATKMVLYVMNRLKKLEINKINLIAFKKNDLGNKFWTNIGFDYKENINMYEKILNYNNIVEYNS